MMIFVGHTDYTKWARSETGFRRLGYDPNGSPDRNFDLFLEYLAQTFALDPARANPHWRPQTLNIAHGEIDYAVVGRVERMRADLRALGERLGHRFPDLDAVTGPHFNHARKTDELLAATASQRARVRQLFAADYDAFSY